LHKTFELELKRLTEALKTREDNGMKYKNIVGFTGEKNVSKYG
jgi:hypothetical protein